MTSYYRQVKHILNGEAPDAEKLEKQILEIYDRLYESWVTRVGIHVLISSSDWLLAFQVLDYD